MECPTVRIKATTGSYPFTTINETDFDPAKHERYVEGDAPAPSEAAAAAAEAAAWGDTSADKPKRGRK